MEPVFDNKNVTEPMKKLTRRSLACFIATAIGRAVSAQELGEPPLGTVDDFVPVSPRPHRQAVSVVRTNRADVANFYQTTYLASQAVPMGWNGNRSTCTPGTNSQAYADATILRVNYYRAMVGLPGDVTLSNVWSGKCQEAALMMSANGQLSHFPPTSWSCYTANGAEAAGKSNIGLGTEGAACVDLYIDDPGGGGNAAVGHRRWILFPPTKIMGTGSIPSSGGWAANDLWVIGGAGSRPAQPAWVAWPPQGYIPYQVLPKNSRRWSFSYAGATFTGASVFMQRSGTDVPVTLEAQAQGYGDNTIVWVPQGVPATAPASDITYSVTVSNVVVSGTPRVFNYNVTIIDPYYTPPPDPILTARLSTNRIIVTWPSVNTGYTLQQSSSLANATNWSNVATAPQVISNRFSVTLDMTPNPTYYRLRK
jgi:hypothetical protein